jgi:phospholipid N-methyltransferase
MANDDAIQFLIQFRRHPRTVGAILPSSRELAESMIAPIDFNHAQTIVEFGPGAGVITAAIARNLQHHSRYLGIEINEAFHKTLTARFPHLAFFHRSAEHAEDILAEQGIEAADAIVSGLPWATLRQKHRDAILKAIHRTLRPGGVFISFAYLQGFLLPSAWTFRNRLKAEFADVAMTPVIWRNVPPAFTYVCRK